MIVVKSPNRIMFRLLPNVVDDHDRCISTHFHKVLWKLCYQKWLPGCRNAPISGTPPKMHGNLIQAIPENGNVLENFLGHLFQAVDVFPLFLPPLILFF